MPRGAQVSQNISDIYENLYGTVPVDGERKDGEREKEGRMRGRKGWKKGRGGYGERREG